MFLRMPYPTSPQSAIVRYRRHLVAMLATVSALTLLSFCAHASAADKVTLSVTSPKAGATISGTVKFTASAKLTGAAKVVSVAFYVDSAYVGSDRTVPYTAAGAGTVDTTLGANGSHVFKAIATVKGKTAKVTTASTVSVNNPVAAATPAPTPSPTPPAPTAEPTTPVSTPPVPVVPDPSPLGASGNWSLKFADDFSDANSSIAKWNTQRNDWLSGGIPYNSLEGAWYRTENVGVSGGNLSISVTDQAGNGYAQSSGMVNTRGKFDFRYGFLEARIRVPKCTGCWPAFWTLPATDTWPPEIDIFEFPQSGVVTYPYFSYHWPDATDASGQKYESNVYFNGSNYDYTDSWHTYGLYWGPDKLQVYLDGLPGPSTTNPLHIPAAAMYPILQLATGAQYTVPAGSTMLTDYVRVWQTG